MHSLAEHSTIINGHRVAYGILGSGKPIVFIHGTPSSSYIWRNVAPNVANEGYSVHVYDLLGYGNSERPYDQSMDTSVSAQVPILKQLMAHWGIERAHIVAHDIGGGVAQRFCIFHPAISNSRRMINSPKIRGPDLCLSQCFCLPFLEK